MTSQTSARVKLTFPDHLIRQPIIARLAREFDVMPNIRRASVEEHVGWMICELGGDDEAIERAIEWLHDLGVQVDRLGDLVEG
jgi:ABC-type methionine transport system ATPase subunit